MPILAVLDASCLKTVHPDFRFVHVLGNPGVQTDIRFFCAQNYSQGELLT